MPNEKNINAVEDLRRWIQECSIAISADYSGLPVGQMTDLRRALREKGVQFRVVKNTLTYLAADAAGKPAIKEIVQGPTGIAFGYGEPTEPARAMSDFIRASRSSLAIRGAVLGDRALTADQVQQLANLPSREQLIASLLGQMQSPIAGLVYVLNGPIAGLARVLQRHVENLGQQAEG